MVATEFVIWARTNPEDPHSETKINTQMMLKRYAKGIQEKHISNLEENRLLLTRFFTLGSTSIKKISQKVVDKIFDDQFSGMDQVKSYFKQNNLISYFDDLEDENGYDLYLSGVQAEEYLTAAHAMVHALEAQIRYQATAVIALNCMALAIYPGDLPANLRKALLAPWKKETEAPTDGPLILQIGWEDLAPGKEPVVHMLRNDDILPREVKVKESTYHKAFSLWIPAGGQLAALRVGQKVTCIRGSVCANGDFAACIQNGELVRYRISDNTFIRNKLEDPDGISDLALDPGGRAHLLEGTTAKIWDNMTRHTYEKIISICAKGNIWVILRSDGCTYSNMSRMICKDVISMAQNEADILLLDRSGKVHSLSRKEYTQAAFWNCMMGRFLDLPEGAAERLVYGGRELQRTTKGELLCRSV